MSKRNCDFGGFSFLMHNFCCLFVGEVANCRNLKNHCLISLILLPNLETPETDHFHQIYLSSMFQVQMLFSSAPQTSYWSSVLGAHWFIISLSLRHCLLEWFHNSARQVYPFLVVVDSGDCFSHLWLFKSASILFVCFHQTVSIYIKFPKVLTVCVCWWLFLVLQDSWEFMSVFSIPYICLHVWI